MLQRPLPVIRSLVPKRGIRSSNRTCSPSLAERAAAKSPEGPPPITTTSYLMAVYCTCFGRLR